jgi:hypothetical protein
MRGVRQGKGRLCFGLVAAIAAVLAVAACPGCRGKGGSSAPASGQQPAARPADRSAAGVMPGGLTVGPYLLAPDSRSMTVCWATQEPQAGRVEFGETAKYGRRVEANRPQTRQKVTLAGLTPGAAYHYRVVTGNEQSTGDFTFRALPGPGEPVTFVVDGDQRATDRYKRHLAAYKRIGPAFVISLGDIANDNAEDYDYILLLDRQFWASTPWQVVYGNHDHRQGMRDVFAIPEPKLPEDAKPAMIFYSYRAGPCHFCAIDEIKYCDASQLGERRLQADWVKADLAAARADKDVRFVITLRHDSHRSLWSLIGARDAPFDVYFFGGIHNYFRGVLDSGVTVVQCSGGGVDYMRGLPEGEWIKTGRVCLNYVRVDAKGDRLTLRAYDLGQPNDPVAAIDGDLMDNVELGPLAKAPLTQPDEYGPDEE